MGRRMGSATIIRHNRTHQCCSHYPFVRLALQLAAGSLLDTRTGDNYNKYLMDIRCGAFCCRLNIFYFTVP